MTNEWFNSRDNLRELVAHMIDTDGELDVVYFLEKPWKWQAEWDKLQETKS